METAIYLFCLARSSLLQTIEGKGLDEENPLCLKRFLDITAVISAVALDDFCGPLSESRMQDLAWVGSRACRHEEVVEQVMRQSPVLPLRFGTIFSAAESLEKRLEKHHEAISQFLDKVTDRQEWAVKGMLDRARARDELLSLSLAKEEKHLASSSPGIRYFQEQRIRTGVEKELKSWLLEVSNQMRNDLSRFASEFCQRRLFSREVTGNDRDMVLNWALLIQSGALTDFRTRIEQANQEFARRGLVFELSGPWPPYSFTPSLEMESDL